MSKIKWKVLILSLLIVFIVGAIGSFFVSNQINSNWYKSVRAPITPPNFVFPIVWSILFLLIGISFYLCLAGADKKQKTKVEIIFGINFILNILWSYFYFYLHNPVFSFADIILLEISILWMIFISYKINKKAGIILIPYFLWVGFAAVLNWLSIM